MINDKIDDMENSLLKNNKNIQIVISASDLREVFLQWVAEFISKDDTKQERYLERKDVTKKYGFDVNSLNIYRKKGLLKYTKNGQKILYKESDIEKMIVNAFLNSNKQLDKERKNGETTTL